MRNTALTSTLQVLDVSCNISNNGRKRDFLWHICMDVKKMDKKKLFFRVEQTSF